MGGLRYIKKPLVPNSLHRLSATHHTYIDERRFEIMTDLKLVLGFRQYEWTNTNTGVVYPVKRLFVEYPSTADGLEGHMCSVVKCKGDKVFDGVMKGDYVQLMYDQYGNCVRVEPLVPEPEDLKDFGIKS